MKAMNMSGNNREKWPEKTSGSSKTIQEEVQADETGWASGKSRRA